MHRSRLLLGLWLNPCFPIPRLASHHAPQVVPSLGQVKVLHRRLAAAASPGEGAPPFPQLAAGWAAAHKGKAFTDQAREGGMRVDLGVF